MALLGVQAAVVTLGGAAGASERAGLARQFEGEFGHGQ